MTHDTPEHQQSHHSEQADARMSEGHGCAHDANACGCGHDASVPSKAAMAPKALPPAAMRALAEAEARRQADALAVQERPAEYDGPAGPEPTRYGDWERKGIVSDF